MIFLIKNQNLFFCKKFFKMCNGKRLNTVKQNKIDIYNEQEWSINNISKRINRSNE